MTLRTYLIWLGYFWPLIPGFLAALGAGWLFWGLGLMWSVVVPLLFGAGVFFLFAWVQIATGGAGPD